MRAKWALIFAIGVVATAACQSDDTTTATVAISAEDLVLDAEQAPAGTVHVATASWEDLRTALDGMEGDIVGRLEALGLRDGSFSVFIGDGSADDEPIDLAAGGRLRIDAALTFPDRQSAQAALDAIEAIAEEYAGAFDAPLSEMEASTVADDAVGVTVDAPTFPGGVAAVAWVEEGAVRMVFAQGGDADLDALDIAGIVASGQ